MSESSERHQPPAYPTDHLGAIFGDPAEAAAAAEELRAAGFAEVSVYEGVESLERFLGADDRRGALQRLWSFVERSFSDFGDYRSRALDHLERGHAVVSAHAGSDARVQQGRALLAAHGGEHIVSFGRWTMTDLPQG